MSVGIIYKTTHRESGRYYIGQHRCYNAVTLDPDYLGSSKWIIRARKKYGDHAFDREVLWKGDGSADELNAQEARYVNEATLADPLCMNRKVGGDCVRSPEYMSLGAVIKRIIETRRTYGKCLGCGARWQYVHDTLYCERCITFDIGEPMTDDEFAASMRRDRFIMYKRIEHDEKVRAKLADKQAKYDAMIRANRTPNK